MRLVLALIVALATFMLAVSFVSTLGFLGNANILLSLVVAGVVFFLVKGKSGSTAKLPDGFVSSFAHDNIAIDQQNGKLWLRSRSGDSKVVDKADVLRWNVAYVSRGAVHYNNKLEVHVRDLRHPKIDVHFDRYRDANRNSSEAEEWASRLTTWINNL